jgi:NADPH:quinone reductase-like Zn-dependent oxidoreductase
MKTLTIMLQGQGLYQALGVPLPGNPSKTPIFLMIYGGTTSTAILGIPFAKLSGCRIAVTCSPRSFDLVKSLGAEAAFDYNSFTVAADIKKFTEGRLHHVWDCIGSAESAKTCALAMSDQEGQYVTLNGGNTSIIHEVNAKISVVETLAYTIFGERFEKFGVTEPIPKDYEFGKMFWELTRDLLATGKLKTAKPEVNRGTKGLEGVLIGMQELKDHKVSGTKLVYTL